MGSGKFTDPPEDRGVFFEYVEGCGDAEETYEEVWQHVNEKELLGWKLRGIREDSFGGVELSWDDGMSDGKIG